MLPQVLYMANNNVKDWGEFNKLAELPKLEELIFVGKLLMCMLDTQTCQMLLTKIQRNQWSNKDTPLIRTVVHMFIDLCPDVVSWQYCIGQLEKAGVTYSI